MVFTQLTSSLLILNFTAGLLLSFAQYVYVPPILTPEELEFEAFISELEEAVIRYDAKQSLLQPKVLQPLEQFDIYSLHELALFGFFDLSITNYWLVCFFLVLLVGVFLVWPLGFIPVVPSSWQLILDGIYAFLVKLFSQHVNNFHSLYYFPIISTIFITVLFANLLGLMPYNFTLTSHIFTTLTLSLTMFIGTIIISLYYNKLNYFKFFVPKGIDNKPLKYFLVFIEIISYIIRPFSLAIRLFANMLAGHTLLYILNTFLVYVTSKKIFALFLLPMTIIFMVFILEFAIAFIQAYVFTTLLVIYINDIYNVSH